jgi:hypothetical protein
MRRIMGAVLVGLGALLLVLAIGLPTFLAPAVAQVPSTLQLCNKGSRTDPAGCLPPFDAKATNATYLQFDPAGAHINTGDLVSTLEVVPRLDKTASAITDGSLQKDAQIWDVYSTTKDTGGTPVAKASGEVAVDRKTGAAVPWSGQFLDDDSQEVVTYSGNEYQFPFNAQAKDYAVFDDNLKTTATAKYTSTDSIDGLDAYHLVIHVPSTQIQLPRESIDSLMQLFAPNATSAKLMYTDDKQIWFDPTTGVILKVEDHQTKTFVADDGTSKVFLDGDFKSLDSETAEAVSAAKKNSTQLKLVGVYGPIGFAVIGLILLLVGLVLVRSNVVPQPEPGWDDNLPEPRHRL